MNKPVLVVMAAGMGSRYGGLKQLDPVDPEGHVIVDYSVFDAAEAGFERVAFIVNRGIRDDFHEMIGKRIAARMDVSYVFQEMDNIPEGFAIPEGRVKPWGTAHAVMSCLGAVDAPFAVINADDFYGKTAFRLIYDYLKELPADSPHFTMVGYELRKTLTENGHVSRGVCTVSESGMLEEVTERVRIMRRPPEGTICYTEDRGETWFPLPEETTVSMNMWGFSPMFLTELAARFAPYLTGILKNDPMKGEYPLPTIVSQLLDEGKADVTVLKTPDQWHGVTYHEDKESLMKALADMKASGLYPENF